MPVLPCRFQLAGLLALFALSAAPFAQAETVTTSDYIYIAVEAEDHIAKDERWVLTEPGTAAQENDPDGNHSDQASGSAYLELLPDLRVTHADEFGDPPSFWGAPGQGPFADYTVQIPEPGRYYVHMRAYSTGTEDNGIHVGIDGTWPQSGKTMQWCSSAKRAWWWSSAQRDSGGMGSCGIEKSIWLDINTAGEHTLSISAREDGFELDRIVLIKDLRDNTKVCSPVNVSDVSCKNGSIETEDGFIDMRVRIETDLATVDIGDTIDVTALLENLDNFDTANNIVLSLPTPEGVWDVTSMDNRCTQGADAVECSLASLHPTAPDENAPFAFSVTALSAGEHAIEMSVSADEADKGPSNDVASADITVNAEPLPETDVSVRMSLAKSVYTTDESIPVSLVVENLQDQVAAEVSVSLSIPDGVAVDATQFPAQCSAGGQVVCSIGEIAASGSSTITLGLFGTSIGQAVLAAQVSAVNDSASANNAATAALRIVEVDDAGSSGTTSAGSTTTGANTGGAAGSETDTGSIEYFLLLVMLLALSARLYRWHQRELVTIAQKR